MLLERAAAVISLEQYAVQRKVAVFIITRDGKARRSEMNPDLVGASGL